MKTHLTSEQRGILLTLAFLIDKSESPIKITDLLPYHDCSLVNISLILDRLEKKGLVKKLRDLEDRRVVRIVVTPKGRLFLKKSSLPTVELMRQVISVYTDTELKESILSMNKFMKSIERYAVSDKKKKYLNLLSVEQTADFLTKLVGGSK